MIKKLLIFFGVVILVVLIFGSWVYVDLKNSASATDSQKIVTIESGDKTTGIAEKLFQAGLIKNKFSFEIYCYFSGKFRHFQTGRFYLNPHDNAFEVANSLTKKPKDEIKVTIPEGWRATQIGERLESLGIISKTQFLLIAQKEEGYLFPDTYYFLKNTSAEDVVSKMKDNFIVKTKDLKIDTKTLIIASIVEREAKLDTDRPKVASVFYNRLAKNMKLEADSTVQYALGSWDSIKASDLKISSPYNTYQIAGLPPAPIANPGLPSITAAANPAQTDYLYFINTPDGKAYFAKTADEQQANIQKYLK